MVFSSTQFLFLFLPLALLMYFAAPRPMRNVVLLVTSLAFYFYGEQWYALIMIASIVWNYGFGLAVGNAKADSVPRFSLLALAVGGNLALLLTFKYANLIDDTIGMRLGSGGALPEIHLPIGISFFTFQSISYVVDVYRGVGRPQRNPIALALYISLFPQLIAGPIVRYTTIASQLVHRTTGLRQFVFGMRRFIIGLAKKVIIADTLANIVDRILSDPSAGLTTDASWIALIMYTLQIYFDFSGYSDMAIGLGRVFGFEFEENFNYPYTSRSVNEFWRRWHMSLSSWFRDYLYIPLGGGRASPARVYFNLTLVFLLCGLWHGASWSFMVWGLYHGCFLVLERVGLTRWMSSVPGLSRIYTLTVVMGGWVLFRSDTLGFARLWFMSLVGLGTSSWTQTSWPLYVDPWSILISVAGVIGSTPIILGLSRRADDLASGTANSQVAIQVFSWIAVAFLFAVTILMVMSSSYSPFIYFRF